MATELQKVKHNIKAVSSDEALNKKTMIAIVKDTDCFGVDYDEKVEPCQKCNILMELNGRRDFLFVFCKELSEKAETAKSENIQEEKDMTEEKEVTKVKEEKVKKESRPKMLARKVAEGKTLEQCLGDEELLAKYSNKKAWIKMDFGKIKK